MQILTQLLHQDRIPNAGNNVNRENCVSVKARSDAGNTADALCHIFVYVELASLASARTQISNGDPS
eukprot:2007331-Pleurochrysis_carterae.AAC.1